VALEMGKLNRAEFLGRALSAAAGISLFGLPFVRSAFAAPDAARDSVLVVLFLRGACDGLSLVCPVAGADRKIYELERPNLKTPLDGPSAALPLAGGADSVARFGFHPKAKGLHRLFQEKKLAVVPATGLTANSRSHFDAQNFMELGTPDKKTGGSGWATRLLDSISADHAEGLPGLAIGSLVPVSLYDFPRAVSVSDLGRLNLAAKSKSEDHQSALQALYATGDDFAHRAGRETLGSLQLLQNSLKKNSLTDADYPKSDLGNKLKTLSHLLRLNLGIRVASVDMGGWDTHKSQGVGLDGTFAKQVEQLSDALDAFEKDLAANASAISSRVTVVVMTEFGRRLRENANRGTDHGHGGVFLAYGAGIQGGKVLGKWPGLATENLYERADVAVANDFRQPLSEILDHRFGVRRADSIFPGFKPGLAVGITRA
jgi:uncharacterized protein (DUF1501 family)